MLETLMKLYVASMGLKCVTSPTPHLFGPPGTGKSTVVHELGELVSRTVHTVNVSRLSPLEIEGLQMPIKDNTALHMLTATFWTRLKDGDILLLDEFLRGFPEVYNGLLDILTSRRVGDFVLPKVFIIAASNSTVAYDKALEDRLLHITVPDIRRGKNGFKDTARRLVEEVGLLPEVAESFEMNDLIRDEIVPMYSVLDQINGRMTATTVTEGHSLRNLIGQAQLRHVTSTKLAELIEMNNVRAMREGKIQYVVLTEARKLGSMQKYVSAAQNLVGNPRLTDVQARNLDLNLQLISMEEARKEMETPDDLVI